MATYDLKPPLNRLDGVSTVTVQGEEIPNFQITPDTATLIAAGVTILDILNAVQNTNLIDSPGLYQQRQHELVLALVGSQAHDTAELSAQIVVKNTAAGVPVHISDVADVAQSIEPSTPWCSANGKPAVLLNIARQPSSNTVTVADEVAAEVIAAAEKSSPPASPALLRPVRTRPREHLQRPRRHPHRPRPRHHHHRRLPARLALVAHRRPRHPRHHRHHLPLPLRARRELQPHDPRRSRRCRRPRHRRRHRRRREHRPASQRRPRPRRSHPQRARRDHDPAARLDHHPDRRLPSAHLGHRRHRQLLPRARHHHDRALLSSLLLALTWTPPCALILKSPLPREPELETSNHRSWVPQEVAVSATQPPPTHHEEHWLHAPRPQLLRALAIAALARSKPLILFATCALLLVGIYFGYQTLGTDLLPEMDEGAFILDSTMPPGSLACERPTASCSTSRRSSKTPEVETTSRRTGLQLGLAAVTESNYGDMTVKLKRQAQAAASTRSSPTSAPRSRRMSRNSTSSSPRSCRT
jgi:multidrug efflux pump subunit AcrB